MGGFTSGTFVRLCVRGEWMVSQVKKFQWEGVILESPVHRSRIFPEDILWNDQHFATKPGMVMHHFEAECHAKQKLCAIFHFKVIVRAYIIIIIGNL